MKDFSLPDDPQATEPVPGASPTDFPNWSIRRLLLGGFFALLLFTIAGGLLGGVMLVHLREANNQVDLSFRNSDAIQDLHHGVLQVFWAMELEDQGKAAAADRVFKEALTEFNDHLAILRQLGMMPASELRQLEARFNELFSSARNQKRRSDGVGNMVQEVDQNISRLQGELDSLFPGLEGRADQMWEAALQSARQALRVAVIGFSAILLSGVLLCVLMWLVIARRTNVGLTSAARRISSATRQLKDAVQHQVTSASEQSSAAVQISSTMQELLASSRNMTDKSREMVSISRQAALECDKGNAALGKSKEGMGQIKAEVVRITEHMRTLSEKSQQINSVVEIINELASQTNLLSLNATIEATGAGESGKRFAVVAEEIRLLAERAVESTGEIRSLIESIQETARMTGIVTMDGARVVDRGLESTSLISENFDTLMTLVTQTADAIQSIEATAQEQSRAVEQVTEAVEMLSQISTESEKRAGETLQTVGKLTMTARGFEFMASKRGELEH